MPFTHITRTGWFKDGREELQRGKRGWDRGPALIPKGWELISPCFQDIAASNGGESGLWPLEPVVARVEGSRVGLGRGGTHPEGDRVYGLRGSVARGLTRHISLIPAACGLSFSPAACGLSLSPSACGLSLNPFTCDLSLSLSTCGLVLQVNSSITWGFFFLI